MHRWKAGITVTEKIRGVHIWLPRTTGLSGRCRKDSWNNVQYIKAGDVAPEPKGVDRDTMRGNEWKSSRWDGSESMRLIRCDRA